MHPLSESGFSYDFDSTAGHFPYRAGIHSEMYRVKPWTIRQYAGFGTAKSANERLKALIDAGATGLSIAFDLPTQMGFDPNHDMSIGEVGKVGVSISTLNDMRELFEGIDIAHISTSMTINATAPIILLMYELIALERGINPADLRGTIQNDILKEYISRGTFIFSPEHSMNLVCETIKYCKENLPNWNPISISGYHMAEAGATPVQEVAFTFANAISYLDMLTQNGEDINFISERLTFFFAARITLLEEVAKFRAAREVWAKIMKSRYKATSEKSLKLRFHTQTAGVQLIAQNPELNTVRVTVQAIAAILGGSQSIHTNAFDEAISLPNESSATFAIRTQQILQLETDLAKAVDPFEGSHLMEKLTTDFVVEIEKEIEHILDLGGAVHGIERNYQKEQIEANAYRIAKEIDDQERPIIGLNVHQQNSNGVLGTFTSRREDSIEPNISKIDRMKTDEVLLRNQLDELAAQAGGGLPIISEIRKALLCGASVGEICEALKRSWGSFTGS